ncbi:MAG TPA: hypothetical protein DEH78_18035 [Solibacterales bacterium]|nr:hypothetical protein [Bryobacterales bacterium]
MTGIKWALLATAFAAKLLYGEPGRFDHVVRNDFFAGFAGDREALERAMSVTANVLKHEPQHAEALVWHGAGSLQLAGEAFRAGNSEKGIALWTRAIAQMREAVALAPRNVGVRAPRGATLFTASRFSPPDQGRALLAMAIEDYETILEIQSPYFDKIGTHPKGELLFGLAEGYARAGNTPKATEFFHRINKELPGTVYAKRAGKWLAGGTLEPAETRCVGCHVSQ